MPPKKRRTGGPAQPAPSTTSNPTRTPPAASPNPALRPVRGSALHDTPRHAPTVRYRPAWHKVIGVALLAVGVALAVTNDMELLGGPHPPLPGGHSEGYLLVAGLIAATSMWWFGLFDRAR